MPNHITNRIKLIGEPAEIRRVMEAVKVDKIGLGSLDFEKIIPMPTDVDDSYNWCIETATIGALTIGIRSGTHTDMKTLKPKKTRTLSLS